MGDLPNGYITGARLWLQPEWAAREGNDKSFYLEAGNKGWAECEVLYYEVPAGKTLYINSMTFMVVSYEPANADKDQMGLMFCEDSTTGLRRIYQGGNGGGASSFPTPIVIPAGHKVAFAVCNRANHSCEIRLVAIGYEI